MVVLVAGMRFAVLAEIGIVANSALVARTLNIREVLLVLAQRSIAVDAIVTAAARKWLGERLVDRDEAMTRVNDVSTLQALGTVIPVWAVQALVTDAIDELVTAVTNCRVARIPSWAAERIT